MVTEPVNAGVYPTLGGLLFGCYICYYVLMVVKYFATLTIESLGHIVAFCLYLSANNPLQALSYLLLAIFAVSFLLDRNGRAALRLKVLGISFLRRWCAWQNAFLNAQKKAQMLMYQDTSGSDTSSVDSTLSSPQAVAAAAREGLTSHRLSAATFKTNSNNSSSSNRRRRRSRKLTFTTLQQQQQQQQKQHASSPPLISHSSSGDQDQLPLERNLSWTEWAGYIMRDNVLRPLWPDTSSTTSDSTDTPPISPQSSPVKKRNPSSSSSSSVPPSSPLTQQCRHYTHGGISAHPTRRDALENVACAARLQLSSCSLHSSTTTYPGHISISSSNNSGKSQGSTTTTNNNNNNNNDDAGQSAVASIGLDGDCPQSVRDVVTDEHLVAFGALIGEKACLTAVRDINLPPPVESSLGTTTSTTVESSLGTTATSTTGKHSLSSTLLGVTDHPEIWLHSTSDGGGGGPEWEPIVSHTEGGLVYRAWRLPLRRGLYAYKTSATFLDVSPRDLRPFHLDDNARLVWDECALSIDRLHPVFESENENDDGSSSSSLSSSDASPPSTTTTNSNNNRRLSKHSEWCLHKYVSKFPRPMAARQYVYARRVWHRPCDGGCYAISTACTVPCLPSDPSSRVVDVKEYVSGCVIRSVTIDNDDNSSSRMGTELLSIYFEDSSVRAGLIKMAVPKAMWPYIQKYDVALRQFADTRANQHHHHHYSGGSSGEPSSSSSGSPRSVASLPISIMMMRGDDDDVASVSSDDGLDKVYAQLKNKSKKKRRYYGIGGRQVKRAPYYKNSGGGGNNTRWLKKVAVAAALKMLHAILMD